MYDALLIAANLNLFLSQFKASSSKCLTGLDSNLISNPSQTGKSWRENSGGQEANLQVEATMGTLKECPHLESSFRDLPENSCFPGALQLLEGQNVS